MEPKKVTQHIEVPRNTGVQGFLRTMEELLKLPRVENINIDARGVVLVTRWVAEEEPSPIGVDFESIQPHAVIRNSVRVKELPYEPGDASRAMTRLFSAASSDRMQPVALVSGANTTFFKWHRATTQVDLDPEETVYGLPFYRDRHLDDYMLFLCAGHGRDARLVDTQRSYKILMPERF